MCREADKLKGRAEARERILIDSALGLACYANYWADGSDEMTVIRATSRDSAGTVKRSVSPNSGSSMLLT